MSAKFIDLKIFKIDDDLLAIVACVNTGKQCLRFEFKLRGCGFLLWWGGTRYVIMLL